LVHRDVKPSNIVFVNGQPKLADIGLVTSTDATRSFVGTLGFAPPEGPGTVTGDLYSLGKVLYETSTGLDRQEFPELPTRLGSSPAAERELVELNQIILKACDPNPRDRYQSAEAMRGDLALLESGRSVVERRRNARRLTLLIKSGFVIAALGGAVALLFRQHLLHQERLITAEERPAPSTQDESIPDAQFQFQSLVHAIRARAEQFVRLTPEIGFGQHVFRPFRLNVHPLRWGTEYLDAVRFTTPAESGLDMVWAFTMYNRKLSWQLFPLDSPSDPRKSFQQFGNSPPPSMSMCLRRHRTARKEFGTPQWRLGGLPLLDEPTRPCVAFSKPPRREFKSSMCRGCRASFSSQTRTTWFFSNSEDRNPRSFRSR